MGESRPGCRLNISVVSSDFLGVSATLRLGGESPARLGGETYAGTDLPVPAKCFLKCANTRRQASCAASAS